MPMKLPRFFSSVGFLGRVFFVVGMGWPLGVSAMLPNPDFADHDGNGIPDGWEVKTFVMETFGKKIPCLSMKFQRDTDRPLEGEISTKFEGPAGFYRVRISYLDEFDGAGKAKFLVNDEVQRIWDFDNTFGDVWREEIIENVELKPGDKITLWGRDNPSEYCRIRSIQIEPSPTPPTAQELEERRNPPVLADKEYGHLVALRDKRDLSAMQRLPEFQPLFGERNAPMLFLRKAGENVEINLQLSQPRNPQYRVVEQDASYNGSQGSDLSNEIALLEGDLPYDVLDGSASIKIPAGAEGILEVRVPAATVQSETPHVLLAQNGLVGNAGAATGAFYFFVPRGTTAFGVGAYALGNRSAEVTVYAPDGSMVTKMDVTAATPQGLPIRVRPGQDDAVWSLNVAGIAPSIRLIGIPPYLATHPRHLLVPEECLTP